MLGFPAEPSLVRAGSANPGVVRARPNLNYLTTRPVRQPAGARRRANMDGRTRQLIGGRRFERSREIWWPPGPRWASVRLGLSIVNLIVRVNERINGHRSQLMRQAQKLRGGIVTVACHYAVGMRHRSPSAMRVVRKRRDLPFVVHDRGQSVQRVIGTSRQPSRIDHRGGYRLRLSTSKVKLRPQLRHPSYPSPAPGRPPTS